MLGFCVPVPSLSGRSASLRVLPERAAGRFLKHLIWRILLVIRRPVSGVESIFLPGLREVRSKPAGVVDEVAQRLAGEETLRLAWLPLLPTLARPARTEARLYRAGIDLPIS